MDVFDTVIISVGFGRFTDTLRFCQATGILLAGFLSHIQRDDWLTRIDICNGFMDHLTIPGGTRHFHTLIVTYPEIGAVESPARRLPSSLYIASNFGVFQRILNGVLIVSRGCFFQDLVRQGMVSEGISLEKKATQ